MITLFSIVISTIGLGILLWKLDQAVKPGQLGFKARAHRWISLILDTAFSIGCFIGLMFVMAPTQAAPTAAMLGIGASWVIQRNLRKTQ